MSNAVKEDIKKLVQKELDFANEKFSQFASPHEAYAVIKEEFEECEEEIEIAGMQLLEMWRLTKNNQPKIDISRQIGASAEKIAIEAIQLSAMCKKYMNLYEAN